LPFVIHLLILVLNIYKKPLDCGFQLFNSTIIIINRFEKKQPRAEFGYQFYGPANRQAGSHSALRCCNYRL
jgi:hypothetical protein